MAVRPFDWRDFLALHRYRNQCLFFDSTRLLTKGPRLIPAGALFSYFAVATGVFTYQASSNGKVNSILLGQVVHPAGKACARLSFLTPGTAIESPGVVSFIEHVVKEIGQRGATHLLAEVDEQDKSFEALRRAGFATYARQRIWKLNAEPAGEGEPTPWKHGVDRDLIGIRVLYSNLVPGLVQQVEHPPATRIQGLVYRQEDEILAYVDIKYGPHGVIVQPFIHPDVGNLSARLVYLLQNIPYRRSRPIYIRVRSYQSWLESAIEDLGAEAGPRQAVMVRHLAIPQKNIRTYVLPALERGHPEVSAPITRRMIKKL